MLKKGKYLLLLILSGMLLFCCSFGNNDGPQSGIKTQVDFTIYFDTNGGEVIEPIKVLAGTDVINIEIPTPVKNGCKFVSWLDEYSQSQSTDSVPLGAKVYTYYTVFRENTDSEVYFVANWLLLEPQIIYKANGGIFNCPDGSKKEIISYPFSEIKEQYKSSQIWNFINQKDAELETLVYKEHHKFNYWSQISNTNSVYDTLEAGYNIEFAAKWDAIGTIIFESNGGSEIPPYEFGTEDKNWLDDVMDLYTKDRIPVKEGYCFAGWYEDKECNTIYKPGNSSDITTLYAKWCPKDYVVTHENIKENVDTINNTFNFDDIMYIYFSSKETVEQYFELSKTLSINIIWSGFITENDLDLLVDSMEHVFVNLDLSKADGLAEIPRLAFRECNCLSTIKLPESISKIGQSAFEKCCYLYKVDIPASLESIGSDAFLGCINLESIVIPPGSKSISSAAFSSCAKLKNVTLPDSLTSIGNEVFSDCSSLEEITLPAYVLSISDETFKNCTNLKTVTVSNDLEEIGKNAFEGCEKIESFTIPNDVTIISAHCFEGCKALKTVTIGSNVEHIETSAFCNCSALEEITIPANVTKIANSVFKDCSKLTKINIPVEQDKVWFKSSSSNFSGGFEIDLTDPANNATTFKGDINSYWHKDVIPGQS